MNVNIQGPRIPHEVRLPDITHQLLTRDQGAGGLEEDQSQGCLFWRQENLLPLPDQQTVPNIQTESPPFNSLRGAVGDDTAKTMHKPARRERVPEVPIDTRHLIQTRNCSALS